MFDRVPKASVLKHVQISITGEIYGKNYFLSSAGTVLNPKSPVNGPYCQNG